MAPSPEGLTDQKVGLDAEIPLFEDPPREYSSPRFAFLLGLCDSRRWLERGTIFLWIASVFGGLHWMSRSEGEQAWLDSTKASEIRLRIWCGMIPTVWDHDVVLKSREHRCYVPYRRCTQDAFSNVDVGYVWKRMVRMVLVRACMCKIVVSLQIACMEFKWLSWKAIFKIRRNMHQLMFMCLENRRISDSPTGNNSQTLGICEKAMKQSSILATFRRVIFIEVNYNQAGQQNRVSFMQTGVVTRENYQIESTKRRCHPLAFELSSIFMFWLS